MLKVVISWPLAPALVERIQAVSPEVNLRVLGVATNPGGPRGNFDQMQAQATDQQMAEGFAEADVILCPYGAVAKRVPDLRAIAPKVSWVQSIAAGADRMPQQLISEGVVFTTSSGVAAQPIAEFVLGHMLMFSKGWPAFFRTQQAHEWRAGKRPADLSGHTVGIVGMGHIGSEVARLAHAFDCRVLGIRRSFTSRGPDEIADEAVPPSEINYLMAESDFVVLAAPLTPQTRGIVGVKEIAAMKPTAYLINIARGGLVDEPALVAALKEGRIAGAGLDVFAVEPLPAESELWDMPNVIISPHSAGGSERSLERTIDIFCGNLRRYLAGEPLLNIVDPERGY
ncbi:MAG: D-2-hydroxyacid dehydrogenase [Dehalococcoidia bacterium]|nr:D-2-hydroxyacid dehydrogenase [Dehalococcoidia bacterium]